MKLNFNFESRENHFLTSGISHPVLRYCKSYSQSRFVLSIELQREVYWLQNTLRDFVQTTNCLSVNLKTTKSFGGSFKGFEGLFLFAYKN